MKTVDVHGTIKHETDAALLLITEDGEEKWIPFSLIERIIRTKNKGQDVVEVQRWFAEKEELI